MAAIAKNNVSKQFENLQVSSFSTGKLKSIIGFKVNANLFLMENSFIITSRDMNYKLFHTILPVTIENRKGTIKKVKATNWKTIHVTLQKNTFNLGNSKIDLTIRTNDKEQQLAIYNAIKDWS